MRISNFIILLIYLLICFSGWRTIAQDSEYRAISRLDYYTNEPTGEIIVVIPAEKEGMSIKVDVVYAYEFLNKRVLVLPGRASVLHFPLANFKKGDNEITVSFYENDVWMDSRKVNLRILEDQLNAVKIDRLSGALVADHLPFYPFGFYCRWPVDERLPAEEVSRGFNMISPYWKINKKERKERLEFMDQCAALGMKVNYNLCSVAGGGGVESSRDENLTAEEKFELLKQEVKLMKDHPALLSWYIADEPDGQHASPKALLETYGIIKSIDPYHPVSMVFMAPNKSAVFADATDIVMADPYPVPNSSITEVANVTRMLYKHYGYSKPVWIVPQAFGGNEWWTREPTAAELQTMSCMALAEGASGIQYFIRQGPSAFPKSFSAWATAASIGQQLLEIQPYILSGNRINVSASDPDILATGWARKNKILVLLVNTVNAPRKFSLTVQGISEPQVAKVLWQGRSVMTSDEEFIDGYSARLYLIDLFGTHENELIDLHNLIIDPGFEQVFSSGVPTSCYATTSCDIGSTYFTETRFAHQGERCLRLNTASEGCGVKLSLFGVNIVPGHSYTLSVQAVARPSSANFSMRKPLFGDREYSLKAPEELMFRLSGLDCSQEFTLSDKWEEYRMNVCMGCIGCLDRTPLPGWGGANCLDCIGRKFTPGLELVSKGTAWFDDVRLVKDIDLTTDVDVNNKKLLVSLSTPHDSAKIYYSTDGVRPDNISKAFEGKFPLDSSCYLKAVVYQGNTEAGWLNRYLTVHRGIGAGISYQQAYSEKYDGGGDIGLTNGQLASLNYLDPAWQGFEGIDAIVTFDLGKVEPVNTISMNFLQDWDVWIFLPETVEIQASVDGQDFDVVAEWTSGEKKTIREKFIEKVQFDLAGKGYRYLRVHAYNIGLCPKGHLGEGGKSWIFLDEIEIY